MMRKLFLCTLLVLCTGLQASEKTFIDRVLASAARSNLACWWNDLLCEGLSLSGEAVSADLQLLADEAQDNVGIPTVKRVPVRLKPLDNGTAAITDFNAIYLSPTTFANPQVPYGVKRCDLHHEAVHSKYHDIGCSNLLRVVTTSSVPIVTALCRPKGVWRLLYPCSIVAGVVVGTAIRQGYVCYFERRADQEGHRATGCYRCVREKIEDIRYASKDPCYLSIVENEVIAAELEKQDTLCNVHKERVLFTD